MVGVLSSKESRPSGGLTRIDLFNVIQVYVPCSLKHIYQSIGSKISVLKSSTSMLYWGMWFLCWWVERQGMKADVKVLILAQRWWYERERKNGWWVR